MDRRPLSWQQVLHFVLRRRRVHPLASGGVAIWKESGILCGFNDDQEAAEKAKRKERGRVGKGLRFGYIVQPNWICFCFAGRRTIGTIKDYLVR